MAQGAHSGRPVAAAPCTPGLRPATSPLRGPFDLSLQASGRAEAASVQNTALSPHPCGLPRPSGNVSAILRPPAPAVSATPAPAVIWGCRPGKAQPPPGEIRIPCLINGPKRQPDSPQPLHPCYRWLQRSLRSRLIVCVMSFMAQGTGAASRRRPLYPRAPANNIADLSLQASGRAEAASVQNTALSPHPCGLPRPSGNVSAMLRPQHRQFQQQW